jgi:hypothetical protein
MHGKIASNWILDVQAFVREVNIYYVIDYSCG